MLHMMFTLGLCAEKNWRRQRGFNYLALCAMESEAKAICKRIQYAV